MGLKTEKTPRKKPFAKRHWRRYFQSLREEHHKTDCFSDRFTWSLSALKEEDKQILSQLKKLLSLFSNPDLSDLSDLSESDGESGSKNSPPLWLSYFPRCDEVDVRPLWEELPHFQWALPSISAFPVISSVSSGASSHGVEAKAEGALSQSKEILPSFFQVHLSRQLREQMQGASYCRFQKNTYCIYAPRQERCEEVDIHKARGALVPGVAFDKKGRRLGKGGAYFDRVLKDFSGVKVGLAYGWQWVDVLPWEDHDVSMDVVISENHLEAFTNRGERFLKGTL